MSKRAAQQAYAKAGVKPSDVQVVELHGKPVFKTTEECYS
jgi:acyl transferase domain-containing protein